MPTRWSSTSSASTSAQLYWERYRRPLFVSETASLGSLRRRSQWRDDSVAAVRRLRARGVPLVGYTWWPLFAHVTWGYREGKKPPAEYLRADGPVGPAAGRGRPRAGEDAAGGSLTSIW
ncbi:MAG TPA: hypothetical protein VEQ10_02315 [Vicinamibacteria bacterium]|nr:hypothetical protein [Vicinamibacteria bacterium]